MRLEVGRKVIVNALRFRVGLALAFAMFWTSAALGGHDVTFAAAVPYAVGDFPKSVAIGDLDGDEAPDLAVANWGSGDVSVLLGVGDGTFTAAMNYTAGNELESIAIGDVDGDLVPDLAVASRGSDSVSVLLGVGDGTFNAAVHYATGNAPRSVAIGDLNGDQLPDLAVADDNVSVLLGAGDGTFIAAANYAAGISPRSVAIGDLNSDQVPDLVTANVLGENISVLLGIGDGTFDVAVHYAAGDGPMSVAIGDLNRDQVPDLAVANSNDDTVSVLQGVGDGTFGAAVFYAVGDAPFSLVIADLVGDQVLDLAVANVLSDNISVLLGVGAEAFVGPVHHAAGERPRSIAIADLDGDQWPDVVVANGDSGDVSVLINQPKDCNGNGIPDQCDIDCGPPGGLCDVPLCGNLPDVDTNYVPDECQGPIGHCCLAGVVCTVWAAEDCTAVGGAFFGEAVSCAGDDNGNGVADDCEAVSPLPAGVLNNRLKNRYISFQPNNAGRLVKLQVTLSDSLPHPDLIGSSWWVLPPIVTVPGEFPKPLVGPGECVASLGLEAEGAEIDWDAAGCQTLHVTGCAIEPTSEYEIRAVAVASTATGPTVPTGLRPGDGKWWGDVVGFYDGFEWTPPQGTVNIDDAVVAINTFQGGQFVGATPGSTIAHLSVADVEPGNINTVVNFGDVLILIKAFQGDSYPFGPANAEGNCP